MSSESYGKLVKTLLIDQVTKDLTDAGQVFVTTYANINSNNMNALRKQLRDQDIKYRVLKNTIAKKILNQKDETKPLAEKVDGQCALGISNGDVTAASKVFVEFAKENETFQVNHVLMDGQVYDQNQIKSFSKLPSRQELLAKVCGGLNSPIAGFVGSLSGLIRNFVNVLDQVKSKKESQK